MTAAVKIGDRTYEVAVPYKLRQLEAAAPFIDQLNETARDGAAANAAVFAKLKAEAPAGEDVDPAELTKALAAIAPTMSGMAKSFRAMLGAILPGIQKADPSVTLDSLVDEFEPDQWVELKAAFDAIFRKSGITEAESPATPEARLITA